MRFVLNSNRNNMVSHVCVYDLHRQLNEAGYSAVLNDWEHYTKYDIVIFASGCEDISTARQQNPNIRIGLADPKIATHQDLESARQADFLMVSSIEQRDAFLRVNNNIMIYYMFPHLPAQPKEHEDKSPLIIGYHGNRDHLEGMFETVQPAIEKLAERYPLEFWAMYNIKREGQAIGGIPRQGLKRVRHIQWSWQNYYDQLGQVDIGIVPNLLPIRQPLHILRQASYKTDRFRYRPFNHLLRFKISSNAGRLHPFAMLGIPVVADFYPSACQLIQDGESGFLVSSAHGWYHALKSLIESTQLRNQMALALRYNIDQILEVRLRQFIRFCEQDFHKGSPISFPHQINPEDELAELPYYLSLTEETWRQRANQNLRRFPHRLFKWIKRIVT